LIPQQIQQLLPIVIILAIAYLIILRPANNQRKQLQEMIKNLKSGDRIVTSGGLYGTIVGLKGDRIQVRIAENVKVEMSRNAVTALQESETE
jgi:preprotein translocase subunit YajC